MRKRAHGDLKLSLAQAQLSFPGIPCMDTAYVKNSTNAAISTHGRSSPAHSGSPGTLEKMPGKAHTLRKIARLHCGPIDGRQGTGKIIQELGFE